MKTRFFYFLTFTLGILLGMNACTKPENVTPSDNSFNNYFSNQRANTQKFTINASKDNVITGNKGTKVSIGGKTLRTMSGQVVTGDVTIELKEVTEFSEMILNDAPTISTQGDILTSGGEFYISASQNGSELTLDENASFFITVPAPQGTTDSMDVFIGVDSSGFIAWLPLNADTVNSNTVVPGNPRQNRIDSAAYYQHQTELWGILNTLNEYVVRCNSFGWINCDYFVNYTDICSIKTSADAVFRSNLTKVYFAIPAINSMGTMWSDQDMNFNCDRIPNNTHLKIVALNYHNGKYYICITSHVVNCGSNSNSIDLDFIEIAESQIETYLQQINI